MIIEILASIIGYFLLIILDHFFISLGFFSVWAFLVIYLYQKMHRTIPWIFVLLAGVSLGVTVGIGLGTYLVSAGISILFLFLVKKFTPEEYLLIRYMQYFLSFFIFYILRFLFGELSINGVAPSIEWSEILGWLILSFVSMIICILIDRFYFQIRSGSGISRKGTGIEIRRR